MTSKYQIVKGFRDILFEESRLFFSCEMLARELFARYGYQEIRLPVLEQKELFVRSIGESTDIVEKEMFSFPDKKGRVLVLRPEATASVVRAYLENQLFQKPAVKLFYIGPMFRYERPQKGRYRQFWQIGAEAIGFPGPGIDAELLALLDQYFKTLGLENVELKLNSLGCKKCRPAYREALSQYLKKHKNQLCSDCQKRLERNPLRVLDCKRAECQKITKSAPVPGDFLCSGCQEHFQRLCSLLERLKISYQIDAHLVRGLDYYTKTVFEFQTKSGLGAQNTICAGGRYDDLVEELGGPSTPATGFALGLERLSLVLQEKIPKEKLQPKPEVFIVFADSSGYDFAFSLLFSLRKAGVYAEMSIDEPEKSLRAQLRLADRQKAQIALIVGEEEIKEKSLNLKFLESGKKLKMEYSRLREMAEIDWASLKEELKGAGFAFVSSEYQEVLSENQQLFTIFKIYLEEMEKQEG